MEASKLTTSEKNLRIILAWSFVPAFGLLIPSGVVGRTLTSFIALAPLTITLGLSLLHLTLKWKHDTTLRAKVGRPVAVLPDLFLFFFYLSDLIPFWIMESNKRYWSIDAGHVMLDTYASCCLMINM
jgi:hypothetical protein